MKFIIAPGVLLFFFAGFLQPYISSAQVITDRDIDRTVVLLHGLARSHKSMQKMGTVLQKNGFFTCNIDYPSRKHSIGDLAMNFVLPMIINCVGSAEETVNFVTHSMGGILVRYLAANAPDIKIGRVVMLSPPNGGSEVVDKLGDTWIFEWINGPAGKQLGTSENSLPNSLGPARFEVGIITGDQSINWILSSIIDGEDDGKVSVQNAKLAGMKDFMVIHATHPFIMKNDFAIEQTLHFLQYGVFKKKAR